MLRETEGDKRGRPSAAGIVEVKNVVRVSFYEDTFANANPFAQSYEVKIQGCT
jgi:hypothetical protein